MKCFVRKKKMQKQKLKITLEVLHEVSVEFPETKQFIEENLEQKCLEENTSVEAVINFIFKHSNKELAQETFLIV